MLVRRFAWNPCQSGVGRPFIVRFRSSEVASSREKRRITSTIQRRYAFFTVPLIDIRIRRAKADNKPTKLTGGNGLYLLVKPSGSTTTRSSHRTPQLSVRWSRSGHSSRERTSPRQEQRIRSAALSSSPRILLLVNRPMKPALSEPSDILITERLSIRLASRRHASALLGYSVQNTPRTSDRSDPCWDWPSCLGIDLSIELRRSPSVAGPSVCDLIGALSCTVSVLSSEWDWRCVHHDGNTHGTTRSHPGRRHASRYTCRSSNQRNRKTPWNPFGAGRDRGISQAADLGEFSRSPASGWLNRTGNRGGWLV